VTGSAHRPLKHIVDHIALNEHTARMDGHGLCIRNRDLAEKAKKCLPFNVMRSSGDLSVFTEAC